MEKENWINEVINSTKGIKPVEANPFLFEKILFKIEVRESDISPVKTFSKNWAWAAGLLLVINIVSFTYMIKDKPNTQKEIDYATLSKEMGLPSTTNY